MIFGKKHFEMTKKWVFYSVGAKNNLAFYPKLNVFGDGFYGIF